MNKNITLITGASSEIGQKVINKLSNNNNIILATYYKNNLQIKENKKNKIIKFHLDLSNEKKVLQFLKKISDKKLIPNKVVHIASCPLEMKSFTEFDWEDYEKNFNIQIKSFFLMMRHLLPEMKKNKYGKILSILSSVTVGVPPSHMSPYVTSKYALYGLLKSMASEYSKYKICINSISPGMIQTNFLNKIPKKIIEINNQKVPFGRNVEIKDIIALIEFLMSDKSSFITGTNIPITGGLSF
jgi:3-oxoacyl-[acyl-carrier protein] reductase